MTTGIVPCPLHSHSASQVVAAIHLCPRMWPWRTESLGRPVGENQHDVELALRASHWLGSSASSTSAAARPTAVHSIQFTAPGRGRIVRPACRGIAVSYGSSEASGVSGPGRHVLSTVLTGNRTI